MPRPTTRCLRGRHLPPRLDDLPERPPELFLTGWLPPGPSVAVVGARKATAPALTFTRQLCLALVEAGHCVISGGARGVDAAAHEACLDAGAPTLVVTTGGFDRPYPPENQPLFRRVVAEGGGYLALHPPAVPGERHEFFARNGVLVALASLVVVVEAGFRSGARNAASWARRLQRPLAVVPGGPWNPKAQGCLLELRRGAHMVTSVRDVVRLMHDLGAAPMPWQEVVGDGADQAGPDAGADQAGADQAGPDAGADQAGPDAGAGDGPLFDRR